MALTSPAVSTDPANITETNAALTTLNSYVSGGYSELQVAMDVIADHMRGAGNNHLALEEFNDQKDLINGSALAAASVAATTKAATDAALATMTSYITRYNSRANAALLKARRHLLVLGAGPLRIDRFDAAIGAINDVPLTAETVASDPGTLAEVNTALANTTAFIDTANAETLALLQEFLPVMRNVPIGNCFKRLSDAIDAINTP